MTCTVTKTNGPEKHDRRPTLSKTTWNREEEVMRRTFEASSIVCRPIYRHHPMADIKRCLKSQQQNNFNVFSVNLNKCYGLSQNYNTKNTDEMNCDWCFVKSK